MNITLLGYMGVGKTILGNFLAEEISSDFLDLDDEIERQEEATISEIIESKGELYFRKIENQILNQILKEKSAHVLSLGGGTPVFYDAMSTVNASGISFYLHASPAFLAKRLKNEKAHRPLIAHLAEEDLTEFIAKHLFERNPFYQKAHYTISVENKSLEMLSEEILDKARSHQNPT